MRLGPMHIGQLANNGMKYTLRQGNVSSKRLAHGHGSSSYKTRTAIIERLHAHAFLVARDVQVVSPICIVSTAYHSNGNSETEALRTSNDQPLNCGWAVRLCRNSHFDRSDVLPVTTNGTNSAGDSPVWVFPVPPELPKVFGGGL